MQTPAYLWLELQVAQQCLRENFAQSQVHTKAETLKFIKKSRDTLPYVS
jgi:hypothetical protein